MERTVAILLGLASLTVARPNIFYITGEIANDVQEGYPGQNVEGTYSWISPEGAEFFVKWVADHNGYRVRESNDIPVGLDGIAADGNQGSFSTDEAYVNRIVGSSVVPEINQDSSNEVQGSFRFNPSTLVSSNTAVEEDTFSSNEVQSSFNFNPSTLISSNTAVEQATFSSNEVQSSFGFNPSNLLSPNTAVEVDTFSSNEVQSSFRLNPSTLLSPNTAVDEDTFSSNEVQSSFRLNPSTLLTSNTAVEEDTFTHIIKETIYFIDNSGNTLPLINEEIQSESEFTLSHEDGEHEIINNIINHESSDVDYDVEQEVFVTMEGFGDKITFPAVHQEVPTNVKEGGAFGSNDEITITEFSSEQ